MAGTRIICPHCGEATRVYKTQPLSNLTKKVTVDCSNPDCGARYSVLQTIERTLREPRPRMPDVDIPAQSSLTAARVSRVAMQGAGPTRPSQRHIG